MTIRTFSPSSTSPRATSVKWKMEFGNSFSLDDIRDEVENYLEDLHLVPGSAMVDPEMSDLPGGSNINGRFRKSTLDPVEV